MATELPLNRLQTRCTCAKPVPEESWEERFCGLFRDVPVETFRAVDCGRCGNVIENSTPCPPLEPLPTQFGHPVKAMRTKHGRKPPPKGGPDP